MAQANVDQNVCLAFYNNDVKSPLIMQEKNELEQKKSELAKNIRQEVEKIKSELSKVCKNVRTLQSISVGSSVNISMLLSNLIAG